jgi:WD40 repeat protein
VQLLDVTTGKQKYSPLIGGTVDPIQSMAFSPDGTILAAGSGSGSVQLWDLATSQPIGTPLIPIGTHLIVGFGQISSMAFSPDGKILAVGYSDGT